MIPTFPGNWDNPLNSGCTDNWNDVLKPNCPPVNCPDSSGNQGNDGSCIQNPGTQNPGTQNPGTQNPGTQNPGTSNPDSDQAYIQQVIDLVNQERAKAGLSPVTEAADLSASAAVRAQEITRSFSHTRPDGSNCNTALDQAGISYRGYGENIAYGQRSAEEVMQGWMNSSGHRANILNRSFTSIGVGHYKDSSGTDYWCQLFLTE